MENTHFDFALVKNLRLKIGMTAEELAKKTGLTRASISNLERGNSNPTMGTVKALADAFQLAPSELVRLAEKDNCEFPKQKTFQIGHWKGVHLVFPGFEFYRGFGKVGAVSEFDPGRHENTLEISLVLMGAIRIEFRGQSYVIKQNQALRFKALHEHKVIALEDSEILMMMHHLI